MQAVVIVLFFGMGAAVGFLFRLYAGRSNNVIRATARRMYQDSTSNIWLRNGVALAPVWGSGSAFFGALVVLPHVIGELLLAPTLALMFAAFAASFRVPAPFLPKWLRAEIDQGLIPLARPTRGDWVVLALVAPIAIFTIVGAPLYFLTHAGT